MNPEKNEKPMNNVSPMVNKEAATLADCKVWLEKMAKGGYFKEDYARRCSKAIDDVSKVMGPDEPKTVVQVLAVSETLLSRWYGASGVVNPGTLRVGGSRFNGALNAFVEYLSDPTAFKPRLRQPDAVGKSHAKKAKEVAKPVESQGTLFSPETAKANDVGATTAPTTGKTAEGKGHSARTFPMGDQEFSFSLPDKGIDSKDVLRLACHLLTLAKDFDPTDPSQGRIFTMVRAESMPAQR